MKPNVLRLPISHYCRKVDWAFTDLGVDATSTRIWFRDLADIRDINPENTVPVLELDDQLICGSNRIMRWLADTANEGATLYPVPAVREWEAWADETIGPMARRDAYRCLYEAPRKYTKNPAVWLAGRLARPLILTILKAYKAKRFYDEDDAIRPKVFDRIHEQLGNGPFLFGAQKTAADYATAALIEPILRIQSPSQPHPAWVDLKAYVARVKPKKLGYAKSGRFTKRVRARMAAKA